MAIVVESTSSSQDTTSASITVSKPTGLLEGEMLVALLSVRAISVGDNFPYNTAAGWTSITSFDDGETIYSIQTKVADSGDVAASNFTFTTTSSSSSLSAGLLRCSGNNTLSEAAAVVDISSSTFEPVGDSVSFTPSGEGSLVIVFAGGDDTVGSKATITPVVDGVTFTTLYDDAITGSNLAQTTAFYGVRSATTEVTTYSADFNRDLGSHVAIFAAFNPRTDATGTNTLVTATSTTFTQSGTCDTTGTSVLAEATAEALPQTGQAIDPTKWTTTPKS